MERFVFVAAVSIAIIFGIGAVFSSTGGRHFGWTIDAEGGTAPVVDVAPGTMASQAYDGAVLRIKNTAAAVQIITEDRQDFAIEIDNSAGRAPMPTVSTEGDRVVIDGQLRGRISGCEDDGGANLRGYGDLAAADLPRITIRAPRGLNIERSGAGSTEIGASNSLALDFAGCGAATIGDVAGELDLDIAGAGEITGGAARHLTADVAGAGDITLGAISGGAEIDLSGAGTIQLASLTGDLSLDGAGASNVSIRGGAINTADIDLAGSGDVEIAGPVSTLNVSIMGVGDIDVAGVVGDLDADIAGPGTITVQAVTGSLRQDVAGPGSVRVTGSAAAAPTPATP